MNIKESKNLIEIFITDNIHGLNMSQASLESLLLKISPEDIITLIRNNCDRLAQVTPGNIPQFSNIDLLPQVINVVKNATDVASYSDLGAYLTGLGTKEGAKQKYGENHYKIAVQLGLTVPSTKDFALTRLGEVYYGESDNAKRLLIVKKLVLRIPVIQQGILFAENNSFDMNQYLLKYLSKSTADRRRSNIKTLLSLVNSIAETETQHILNNIIWR